MSEPTLDDVAAMDSKDFANFANNFTPETSPEGEVPPEVDTSKVNEDTTNTTIPPEVDDKKDVDAETPPADADDDNPSDSTLTPEDFYAELSKPMKAAGKDYTFTDPEEIRTLMKKGIGFEKRMGGLKKFERQITALDAEGLLQDENTINLIIDLAKGKPEALKQYIENNQIDVYDVIGLDSSEYSPTKHVESEEDYKQSQVVQEIQSYDGYDLIKPLAEETWDEKSRSELLASPNLAKSMIQAANAGVHDMVLVEAEKVKLLASTPLTDLEAYIQAGTKLHKSGAFDKIANSNSNVSDANTIQPTNVAPQKKQPSRKASTPTMADVADMSAEELQKFAAEHGI